MCRDLRIFLLVTEKKKTLKLTNRKLFAVRHVERRQSINISNFFKARHTLVTYQVLIDIALFVLLYEIMRRWVIRGSEHRWFRVWCLACATKSKELLECLYIWILHFITFSEIYNLPGFTQNNAHKRYFPEGSSKGYQ